MKYNFKIKGIDCANCAAELERAIQKIDGIDNVTINFMMEKMVLEFDENIKEEVIEKIKKVIKKEEPDCTIKEI